MNAQKREGLRESSLAENETGGFTLAGVKLMADGAAGGEGKAERIDCKIEKFRVTKIYNIPIWWDGTEEERKSKILYSEKGFVVVITDDIEEYLKKESRYGQYARDAVLREACKKINESHRRSVFVIMEEVGETEEKEFNQGECWKNPIEGKEDTIIIFKTTDGNWPGGKENIKAERVVLSAIKLETEATDNIKQEARCFCYETTEGKTVYGLEPTMSIAHGGLRVDRRAKGIEIKETTQKLKDRIIQLKKEGQEVSVREVLNALLLGESQNEEYFRLWYLNLWQALVDFGQEYCKNKGIDLKKERETKEYKELKEHRNAIAHWSTEKINYELLTEIQKTGIRVVKNSLE